MKTTLPEQNTSTRSELKENLLARHLEGAVRWIAVNRMQALVAAGFVVMLILIGSVLVLRKKDARDFQWTQLAQAQQLMETGRAADAAEILDAVAANPAGRNIRLYASYYMGLLELSRENFAEAATAFSVITETGTRLPLAPLALVNRGHALERAGDAHAAVAAYRTFIEKHPDHFLAPRTQLALGRALMQSGEVAAARETLGHLIDLYPASVWAQNARQILDNAGA